MLPIVVIAGLSVDSFDAMKRISSNKIAPNGVLLSTPVNKTGYPQRQARKYITEIFDVLLRFPEEQRIGVSLLYVDYADRSTSDFVGSFFPFALPRSISPLTIESGSTRHQVSRAVRDYGEYLVAESQELRRRSFLVKERLDVHNLTPLLLPVTNFQSAHLRSLLERVFWSGGNSDGLLPLVDAAVAEFKRHHPRVTPPNESRSCYSDGSLFFKSPGRHRHGFFRHQAHQGHSELCLINARSRLGSSFDYRFHYDCVAKRSLAAHYPNCHNVGTAPKPTHVNIAPNDYII